MVAVRVPHPNAAPRRELVIAPGLLVEFLLRRRVFIRRLLHRPAAELIIQIIDGPFVDHHHRAEGSLIHQALVAILERFCPDAVYFHRALYAATEFFLQVFQKMPVAVTVTRRAVIEEREIDEVFGATGSLVGDKLVHHPVRMGFADPARMAVVAHPAGKALHAVRIFVRQTRTVTQGALPEPDSGRAAILVTALGIVATVKRAHLFVVEDIDANLHLVVRVTGLRQRPFQGIVIERENALEDIQALLRLVARDSHHVRRAVIVLVLPAYFEMLGRTDKPMPMRFAYRVPSGSVNTTQTAQDKGNHHPSFHKHSYWPNNEYILF